MHPSLEINNIQKLPVSQRVRRQFPLVAVVILPLAWKRVAMAACESGRSEHDLHRVGDLLQGASALQTILLLPVLYFNIDPALIPTYKDLSESESIHRVTTTRVACASLSLQMIFGIFVHMPALGDLGPSMWHRVWPWIYFMHEYRDYLPDTIALSDYFIYSRFLEFVSQIWGPASSVVSSTPGFRVILAKGWAFLFEMPEIMAVNKGLLEICLTYIARLIGSLDFKDPIYFTEIVDGAGGVLDDLAGLVMNFLEKLVHGQLLWEMNSPGFYLRSLARFFIGLNCSTDPAARLYLPLQAKFMETLHHRHHRFTALLLRATEGALAASHSDTEITCRDTFELFEHLTDTPPGYRWLPAAIHAGLIHTMARIAIQVGPGVDDHIRFLLEDILPKGLVHYHVVAATAEILADCKTICNSPEIAALEIFEHWAKFRDLAERRVNLMSKLNDLQSLKACDNLHCGKIQNKSQLRRCSGCNCFYYCNRECQIVDWRHGGHRSHCSTSGILYLGESRVCVLDFHERQFMRALIQEDYSKAVYSLYRERISRTVVDRHLVLCTVFDYEYTPVKISVQPAASLTISEDLAEEWERLVGRVGHSHGLVQLHVMRVPEGRTVRFWVVPLRASTSQVHDAILALTENIPEDGHEDVIATRLEAIFGKIKNLVEIH